MEVHASPRRLDKVVKRCPGPEQCRNYAVRRAPKHGNGGKEDVEESASSSKEGERRSREIERERRKGEGWKERRIVDGYEGEPP